MADTAQDVCGPGCTFAVPSSTELAAAGPLIADYTAQFGLVSVGLDTVALATSMIDLIAGWADALAGPAPDSAMRMRAIDGLFGVYDQAATWQASAASTPLQAAEVANQVAFGQGIRCLVLAEIARQAASLEFATYSDAAALRTRLTDAFDAELDASTAPDGAKAALETLHSATLQAICAAGADKAKLVPYAVARPRPSLVLAQLFYPDGSDVPARAAALATRTGAIHPAFLPARGERLSK
jgi:hypothetical protein